MMMFRYGIVLLGRGRKIMWECVGAKKAHVESRAYMLQRISGSVAL
jgi:hypothetical protein